MEITVHLVKTGKNNTWKCIYMWGSLQGLEVCNIIQSVCLL